MHPNPDAPPTSTVTSTPSAPPAATPLRWALPSWLSAVLPAPVGLGWRDVLRLVAGVTLALLLTAWLSRGWGSGVWTLGGWQPAPSMGGVPGTWLAAHAQGLPWMVASLGATAMLVFGTPSSPTAQPWPVLAGTALAAIVGTLVGQQVGDAVIACALAVGVTVLLMVALRCMHPPAAGLAALIVLERLDGTGLLLYPIGPNLLVLLACAVAFHAATGVRYPAVRVIRPAAATAAHPAGFVAADLDAALRRHNQVLDISRADLQALLLLTEQMAFERTIARLRCADIMSSPAFAVEPDVPLQRAWDLMQQRRIKAMPVVNAQRQVLGMLAANDFMRQWANNAPAAAATSGGWSQMLSQRLRQMVRGSADATPQRSALKVADCMDAQAQPVSANTPLLELLPRLSTGGVHHLAVVDEQGQLAGIVTQTDLVRALGRSLAPSHPASAQHTNSA